MNFLIFEILWCDSVQDSADVVSDECNYVDVLHAGLDVWWICWSCAVLSCWPRVPTSCSTQLCRQYQLTQELHASRRGLVGWVQGSVLPENWLPGQERGCGMFPCCSCFFAVFYRIVGTRLHYVSGRIRHLTGFIQILEKFGKSWNLKLKFSRPLKVWKMISGMEKSGKILENYEADLENIAFHYTD